MGATNTKSSKPSNQPDESIKRAISSYNVSDATSRQVQINIPTTLLKSSDNQDAVIDVGSGTRVEFETHQPNSRSFCVMNLLSESECEALIEETEKVGYNNSDDVKFEYPETYRNNQRMIVINSHLAKTLWGRLQAHLTTEDVFNVAPVGFLSDGMLFITTRLLIRILTIRYLGACWSERWFCLFKVFSWSVL
jgi:hypothetical protein